MDVSISTTLEWQIQHDLRIISLVGDKTIACEFYAALCNTLWVQIDKRSYDEKVVDALRGVSLAQCNFTWRTAAYIIAEIRVNEHDIADDYMDFYCSGNEGFISDVVTKEFERLGWRSSDD